VSDVKSWIPLTVLFVVAMSYLLRWLDRKQRKMRARSYVIEDPELLQEAEKQVRTKDAWNESVVVVTLSSLDGFSETHIADLIAFLGSNGVPATFQKTAVEVGFFTYSIFVPADHIEVAEKLIHTWQSRAAYE